MIDIKSKIKEINIMHAKIKSLKKESAALDNKLVAADVKKKHTSKLVEDMKKNFDAKIKKLESILGDKDQRIEDIKKAKGVLNEAIDDASVAFAVSSNELSNTDDIELAKYIKDLKDSL